MPYPLFFTLLFTNSVFILQIRSLADNDIQLLPQWSDPIPLKFNTLSPPNITSSHLLAINSDGLFVSTTVELSWEEPEEGDNIEKYEVWVGVRNLGEFEQPEESEAFGSILQFQV